jgi:hypothetical protein
MTHLLVGGHRLQGTYQSDPGNSVGAGVSEEGTYLLKNVPSSPDVASMIPHPMLTHCLMAALAIS